jgi:preprotein translocase subunit SecF
MFDFVGKRFWFFLLSALIIIPGIISLMAFGFKPGIDFSSGSTMTLVFIEPVEQADLRQQLAELGQEEAIIQGTHKEGFLLKGVAPEEVGGIRDTLEEEFGARGVFTFAGPEAGKENISIVFAHTVEEDRLLGVLQLEPGDNISIEPLQREAFLIRTRIVGQDSLQQVEEAMESRFGEFGFFDFATVSPVIAAEIVQNAAIAVVAAAIGMLLYISWAFRRMPQPFRYGTGAVIALVHDVLVVLGIFSILGGLFNVEIGSMFITGILAVLGYSVNNTIVVFDRVRENVAKGIGRFEVTVNSSLMQTLGRSLNTWLTTLFVLLALFLFGGVTITNFILVLIIGITAGTYSSIFIASPLLLIWERKK